MASHTSRVILKTMLATSCAIAVLGALTGFVVLESGWYHVGATSQHWQPVHTFLERGMHASVRHHARNIQAPSLAVPEKILQGAAIYRARCLECHGAPGLAQSDPGKSMLPVPGPLVDAARRWQAREMYWITRNGIKMSGMPAWEFHLSDDEIWSVVAFLTKLPELSPQAYAELAAKPVEARSAALPAPRMARLHGDPERGQLALTQYACNACHKIPGVTGSDVYVGPPLKGLAARKFIAGRLPNSPENLALWIRDPKQVDPLTAMPRLDVSDADARDMAAYLLIDGLK
jgi:mono/diheme cytochrome c family protein